MRLTITTPVATVVDVSDATYVRAEDQTGAFGICPGHGDFLTTLVVSVITWRNDHEEHHVAVRGGVLTVKGGDHVSVATRQAVTEDSLGALGEAILARLRQDEEAEAASRHAGTRLEVAALRQIQLYIATGETRLRRNGGSRHEAGQSDEFSQGSLE